MPDFVTRGMNLAICRAEVEELRGLLQVAGALDEATVRDFSRAHPRLSALTGLENTGIVRFDLVAREYPLLGDYRCDLAIGDSRLLGELTVRLDMDTLAAGAGG